jgi:hypothetical protein
MNTLNRSIHVLEGPTNNPKTRIVLISEWTVRDSPSSLARRVRMAETFSPRVRLRMTLALPLMKSKLYVEGARVVGIGHRCGVPAG